MPTEVLLAPVLAPEKLYHLTLYLITHPMQILILSSIEKEVLATVAVSVVCRNTSDMLV